VKHAIDADQRGEYEEALPLYRRALEHFMIGLKYETNPTGAVLPSLEQCRAFPAECPTFFVFILQLPS
jgi:hypothetical protein